MSLNRNRRTPKGFSVLEVLVAISILTTMLIAIYQSFSTSLFILASVDNLWRSMTYTHNELTQWERSLNAPVAVNQGTFDDKHALAGFRWKREILDVSPLPGVIVRKVGYTLNWDEGKNEYTYNAEIYIKPD
ncbi:MAG: prepilin-type N-terminal cleavage/methylation domain-containing protein [SAR324 cluster bacterium]|nr:prepilin-type N-terminal cleavage/methylation domain-containing protein [SAR324 cluster bacterium]